MSSSLYKQPAARCIRFDHNRNSVMMVDPKDLPKGHSCEYCAKPKFHVSYDPVPSAKVQLTKVGGKAEATLPRPTPRCIQIDRNRNVVTMVDDSVLGDDHRCVFCDRIHGVSLPTAVPRIQLASRKPKAPSAYFGKTLERYLEESRTSDEDRVFSQIPVGMVVNSSTRANRRIRSSLAAMGGGSSAHVRATRFATGPTRRRSFLSPRHAFGRRWRSRPCNCVRFDRNRNSVVLVDPSEQTADHVCEHCTPSPNRASTTLTAMSVASRSMGATRSRSGKSRPCVWFDRNRNEVVLVDSNEQSPGQSESDLVIKKKQKTSVMKIRAML